MRKIREVLRLYFAAATWTQTLPDWTASHVRAFDFFGGCPELVIPKSRLHQ